MVSLHRASAQIKGKTSARRLDAVSARTHEPTARPMRLTRSLCMWQEMAQATYFPGCMRPTEGRVHCVFASCFVWTGPTMHACRSCPIVDTLLPHLSMRRCCARLPAASPVTAVRMCLRMHMGTPGPLRFPRACGGPLRPRGPPLSAPTSPLLVMQHLQHKSICCNICPK
jgi:hypothetical protein